MRKILSVLAFAILVLVSAKSYAETVIIKANDIQQLLSGNTAIGSWDGTEYRQFFNQDGSTIYATRNSQSSLGKWRVNEADNTYESWWNHGAWDAYIIMREVDKYFWKDGKGMTYPFEILSGQQLLWQE